MFGSRIYRRAGKGQRRAIIIFKDFLFFMIQTKKFVRIGSYRKWF